MAGLITDYSVITNNVVKHIAPKVAPTVDSEYLKYMFKIDHKQRIYTDTGITGLGMGQIIPDGGVAASDAPIQGFTKNYSQLFFTVKARLSYQSNYFLFEAGDMAKIKANVKKQILDGKNALEHAKNYFGQALLAQGWGTSFVWQPINTVIANPVVVSTIGADGVEYWAQNHPREDGGPVWSNVIVDIVPSPQFTYSSLLAARRQQALKKDGRGNPLMSQLDTLVCRAGSQTAQFAKTIKSTIDKGLAPQQTNVFNNAPATNTFEIIELNTYENLGLTGLMWFMFDSKMKNEDYGFKYVEAQATNATPAFTDFLGNQDIVWNFNCLSVMGASDLRGWMSSYGDGVTV